MAILTIQLQGHLTAEALTRALAPVESALDAQARPQPILVDASDMTGYEVGARERFVEWNRAHRARIERVAVVIKNPRPHEPQGSRDRPVTPLRFPVTPTGISSAQVAENSRTRDGADLGGLARSHRHTYVTGDGMEQPIETAPTKRCPQCSGPLDMRTPHVIIDGSAVRAFCSAECVALSTAPTPIYDPPAPPPSRWLGRLVRVGVGLPFLALVSPQDPPKPPPVPHAIAITPAPKVIEEPTFGPAWPPTEKEWQAEIASDAWIHPLDGPRRRMPIRDSRVFGAERAGDRPAECNNGHCGVDLSGPWGEPVHAAHDGVVDRVQRGPNEEHGGMYVRIAHRGGTIFTQYFHLAAIPRRLEPGVHVKVGEVVGLLGDTGVKRSAPHLHFTISVKPSPETPERYIDPEPLIALWPLRIPVAENVEVVSTDVAPGLPHGAASKKHKKTAFAATPADEAAVSATE